VPINFVLSIALSGKTKFLVHRLGGNDTAKDLGGEASSFYRHVFSVSLKVLKDESRCDLLKNTSVACSAETFEIVFAYGTTPVGVRARRLYALSRQTTELADCPRSVC
jgi:hypothetical protein